MKKTLLIVIALLFVPITVNAAGLELDKGKPIFVSGGTTFTGKLFKKRGDYAIFRFYDPSAVNYVLLTYSTLNTHRGTRAGKSFDSGLQNILEGKNEEAILDFARAVREADDFVNAYFNLGVAIFALRTAGEAGPYFQEALRLNEDFALARGYQGMTLMAEGKRSSAIRDLEKSQLLDSEFIEPVELLCSLYFDNGETEKARNMCYRAMRLHPDNPRTYMILGNIMRADKVYEEAKDYFARAMRIFEKAGDQDKAERMMSVCELVDREKIIHMERTRIELPESVKSEDVAAPENEFQGEDVE